LISRKWSGKFILGLAMGLVVLLAGIFLARGQEGMPVPTLLPENGSVGVYGPVGLVFQDLPRDLSLDGSLGLFDADGSPVTDVRLEWQGKTVWLQIARPLAAGKVYELRLEGGVKSQGGVALKETARWKIWVREPEVAYLGNVGTPDVWRAGVNGAFARQLTFTGGSVYDFAVSPTGEHLAYAAENEQQGLDLWETSRDGGEPRLLLACASDRCASPLYAPDGHTLVYTRSPATGIGTYLPPMIWILDLANLDTRVLVDQPGSAVGGMAWSPDGKRLSFYDSGPSGAIEGSIRVVNLVDQTGFAVPSHGGTGGSWSPDSRWLWFASSAIGSDTAQPGLYAVDVESMEVKQAGWTFSELARYGPPVWSKDGKWIAFSAGEPGSAARSQLWRADPGGTTLQELTHEPFYRYGSYSWSSDSGMLVFQRLEQSSSLSRPQVAVWSAARGEVLVIADDAALPRWMP